MSILLISKTRDMKPFKDALMQLDENLDIDIWPAVESIERVNFAVAWNQPRDQFSHFPNLKVVSSLGAGADHLLNDPSIPEDVKLTRVVAPGLSQQMCDYVTMAVLNITRRTNEYVLQQQNAIWKPLGQFPVKNLTVGVMGLGELGQSVAVRLEKNSFEVTGWARSKKSISNITTFSKKQLNNFLTSTNIAVCLLPLTNETEGVLNLDLFKKLKKPAFLINVARGEHLVEEDLLYALDMDLLQHATLDVFEQEPLPDSHPFWGRDKITITPHVASITNPAEIAEQIVENYKRMLSGQDMMNEIDKRKGY